MVFSETQITNSAFAARIYRCRVFQQISALADFFLESHVKIQFYYICFAIPKKQLAEIPQPPDVSGNQTTESFPPH